MSTWLSSLLQLEQAIQSYKAPLDTNPDMKFHRLLFKVCHSTSYSRESGHSKVSVRNSNLLLCLCQSYGSTQDEDNITTYRLKQMHNFVRCAAGGERERDRQHELSKRGKASCLIDGPNVICGRERLAILADAIEVQDYDAAAKAVRLITCFLLRDSGAC